MNLYENPDFQAFTGGAMRPGGLELTETMLQKACLPTGSRVLDVGCGLGATAALLRQRGMRPSGVDSSSPVLEKAIRAYPDMDWKLGNADSLPWEDDIFQGVLCECSFSLFARPALSLSEFARVLVPGGKLLISDFYRREEREDICPAGTCVAGALSQQELRSLLEAAGFRCLFWQDATDHLRQFTARMVWEFGSVQAFWQALMPGSCGVAGSGKRPRMGYAWSIWLWGKD